jgi:streptogramin lyase
MLKRSLLLVSNVLRPHFMRCRVAALCGVLLVMSGISEKASAQTAHFSGTQVYVAGGGSNIFAVAVDREGDVFFTAQNGLGPGSMLFASFADSTLYDLSGFNTPTGLAVDASGDLFVLDSGLGTISEIVAVNGSIPASVSPTIVTLASGITSVGALTVDSNGNLYFTSVANNAVEEILAVNGVIPQSPTIINLGSGFGLPVGIAVDSLGDVYVGDALNNAVKRIVAVNGSIPASPTIVTVGSGFNEPEGLALDGRGNLYVSDYGHDALKEMGAVNGVVASSPLILSLGAYSGIQAVTLDRSGNIYVGDANGSGGSVLKVSLSGANFGRENVGSTTSVISLGFSFDTAGTLGSISVLTQGVEGLDFADAGSGTCKADTAYAAGQGCTVNAIFTPKFAGARSGAAVLKDAGGNVIATGFLLGTGVGPQVSFLAGAQNITIAQQLGEPAGVALDGSGNVYVADAGNNQVYKETLSGGAYTQSTVASDASGPWGIAVDGAGSVYIADIGNNRILKETPTTSGYAESTFMSSFLYRPSAVAVDPSGSVYVADSANNRVLKTTPVIGSSYEEVAGPFIQSNGVGGLSYPTAVAADANGNVYIVDTDNNRVLKESFLGGQYTQSILPSGGLDRPTDVAVDGTGNVYIVYSSQDEVIELAPAGDTYTSTRLLGGLNSPLAPGMLAIDAKGNVFFSDLFNGGRLLEADSADPPSLSFASTPVGSTSADSPQTVTLTNVGNADLIFPIPASGNNPSITSNFTLDENAPSACPVTGSGFATAGVLAAGSSCVLPINFAPTVVGSLGGSLVLTDNNLNASAPAYATQTVALNGTSTPPVPAVMISPAPGGTLAGPITAFTWTAGSGGTTTYYLWVGTSYGTNNLVNSGLHTTSFTAMLPTNGAPLYVRLWTVINGQFLYHDYTYTESSAGPATMISPAPGSTLTGPGTTFTWTTGPAGTSAYYLWVGTAFGTNNLVNMGLHTTSLTVTLPTNGAPLYVRLWTVINGVFVYKDYSYTESSAGPASMVSPTPGTALSGSVTTFTWATGPAGTTTYYLWLGTAFGTNNLVNMGLHTTSLTVTLPTNGAPLYVRLWTVINGVFVYKDYTYTEFNAG